MLHITTEAAWIGSDPANSSAGTSQAPHNNKQPGSPASEPRRAEEECFTSMVFCLSNVCSVASAESPLQRECLSPECTVKRPTLSLSPCLRRTTPRASQDKPALARSSEAGGGEQGGEGGEGGWAYGDGLGMWEARRGREAPGATSACHQHSLCQQPTHVIRAQQHHRK